MQHTEKDFIIIELLKNMLKNEFKIIKDYLDNFYTINYKLINLIVTQIIDGIKQGCAVNSGNSSTTPARQNRARQLTTSFVWNLSH